MRVVAVIIKYYVAFTTRTTQAADNTSEANIVGMFIVYKLTLIIVYFYCLYVDCYHCLYYVEDHEKRIRVQYNQLLNSLTSVPEIASKMFQDGKLTDKEYERIRKFQSTPIRSCEELLAVIIRNPRDVYESFLTSLKKTKQPHVHQLLTSDQQNSSCSGDQISVSDAYTMF